MPNKPFIPQPVVRALVAFLALLAIVAFALVFYVGLKDVVNAPNNAPPTPSDPLVYFATALASLVGGIIAVGFGVPLPSDGGLVKPPQPTPSRVEMSLTGLTSITWPVAKPAPRQVIGAAYAIIYVATGAAACVVWALNPSETSSLVKNLAMTFVGLVIPIVAGFARDNSDA